MADWNFEDFLQRLEAIKGIGSIEELVSRVPDLAPILKEVDFRLDELDPIEKILRAMTLEERLDPDCLDGDPGRQKRERIADESGSTQEAVDSLISQFQQLRAMLARRSPEDVLKEAIEQHTDGGEPWQTPADAWKANQDHSVPIVDEAEVLALPAPPPEPHWTERLDELLRKIAVSGMVSLSEEEKTFLADASQRYRNRREKG